jgi:tetratricopeptide (TPR) repeat protein
VDAVLAWWGRRDRTRPFFLWVHFFDPHAPYELHGEAGPGVSRRTAYQGEVRYMDGEIGRLVDRLRADGALDAATLVVVGDHGEAFGEHGSTSHATYCYEENVDIPLFVRFPDGRGAGERRDGIVSDVDVAPTLLAAMGLEAPAGIDGLALGGAPVAEDRGVYVESYDGYINYGWSQLAGWIDRRGKYLYSSAPELYDLDAVPGEEHDLLGTPGADPRPYELAIHAVAERPVLPREGEGGVDDALLEQIRGLGYASAGVDVAALPHPLAPSDRPSPASMTAVHALVLDGLAEFNRGRYDAAEERFAAAVTQNPGNLFALDFLVTCRMRQGRFAAAIEPLRRLLDVELPHVKSYFNLGVCLAETGKTDDAIRAFEEAQAMTPDDPRIDALLTRLRAGKPLR